MPLSRAQGNINRAELNDFMRARRIEFSSVEEKGVDIYTVIEKAILAACDDANIVINTDLHAGMDSLHRVLRSHVIGKKNIELEAFKASLKSWAKDYSILEARASAEGRLQLDAQPRGIIRGLRDHKDVQPRVWCEDIDIYESLKDVMVDPREVTKTGDYILPAVSIADRCFLQEHLAIVLKKSIVDGPVKLLVPLNHGGHWRLGKIEITNSQITSAVLWDSMSDSGLDQHPAYLNMKAAVEGATRECFTEKQIQPLIEARISKEIKEQEAKGAVTELTKNAIANTSKQEITTQMNQGLEKAEQEAESTMKAEAVGIQTNGWSCGDFVTQEALRQKKDLQSVGAIAIRDTKSQDPELLRKYIVKQVIKNNPQLKLTTPVLVQENIIFVKQEEKAKKEQPPTYVASPHVAYLAFADWTLVRCVFKQYLGARDKNADNIIEAKGLTKDENHFIAAPTVLSAGLHAAGGVVTEEDYKAILPDNQLFFDSLQRVLIKQPDDVVLYQQLNIWDLETRKSDDKGKAKSEIVSVGIKRHKTTLEVTLYESGLVDGAQQLKRSNQAKAWQAILQRGLPAYQVTVVAQPPEAKHGADCTLHAVFNATKKEHGIVGGSLTLEECAALRKALDETNKSLKMSALEKTVETILNTRKMSPCPKPPKPKEYYTEFWVVFEEAINDALVFATASENPNHDAKKSLIQALEDLQQQTATDFLYDDLTEKDALTIAKSARDLTLAIVTGKPEEIAKSIVAFEETTSQYKISWGWRTILGAVIGAALGILAGAMIGILAGPAAAVTAILAGVKGAMIGASVMGTGGLLGGSGLGFWRTQQAHQEDPLILAAKVTVHSTKQLLPKVN